MEWRTGRTSSEDLLQRRKMAHLGHRLLTVERRLEADGAVVPRMRRRKKRMSGERFRREDGTARSCLIRSFRAPGYVIHVTYVKKKS
jgi:hypothetical protein